MSDRELELSSTEAYDDVYQAQSNLSTAPPPNTSNCTISLLVGLNNETEHYPLIFNTIEYQSYDIFDKKLRALFEIYSSANLLLTYEQKKDCRVKLNEKTFCAFKFFILESGLKRLKIDATTTTENTLSKQDVRLNTGNKKEAKMCLLLFRPGLPLTLKPRS